MVRTSKKNHEGLISQELKAGAAEQARADAPGEAKPGRVARITVRGAVVQEPPAYDAPRIRAIRERMGLSQPVFALALNVSVQTVRGWEQGIRAPDGPTERLLEIADRHPEAVLDAVQTSFHASAAEPSPVPKPATTRTPRPTRRPSRRVPRRLGNK